MEYRSLTIRVRRGRNTRYASGQFWACSACRRVDYQVQILTREICGVVRNPEASYASQRQFDSSPRNSYLNPDIFRQ